MRLKVNEIFYSIQGESTFSGRPCIFIRLTGCNLRCSYCDTKYAYEEGEYMSIDEIIDRISHYRCRLVEVTGGEPLIQEDTPDLIKRLLEIGYTVLLETNGTMDIGVVDKRCIKIMDIKCPFSGEARKNNYENIKKLSPKDEIKFVIADRRDYEFAKSVLNEWSIAPFNPNPVHFSPAYGILDPKLLSEWILKDGIDVRLNLQIHKFIWGDKRGV